MSDYDAKRIEKPKSFRIAPLKSGRSGRGTRSRYVIGFDSEADTRTGRPMLFQFSLPEHPDESDCILVTVPEKEHAGLTLFLHFISTYCTRKDVEYIIYGWNVAYELTQILHDMPEDARSEGEFLADVVIADTGAKFAIHTYNDKRHMMTVTNMATKRQVRVLDGMSFFKTSLDKAAKMLGVGEKYQGTDEPCNRCGSIGRINERLCQRCGTRDDLTDPDFLRYARTDAYITRRIGEYVGKMHDEYDVTTCISAPHFASKVFKRRYLKREVRLPEEALEQAGLWSYHGGKNGFYLPGPTELDACYQYDITSAYPEAMRQLPNIELATWHKAHTWQPNRHAIYKATIAYRRCTYRGMMDYKGHWPDSGIHTVYLTSYEVDSMMRHGECDILAIEGWTMRGPNGGPLVDYVDEFFDMKARTEGPERETAKLFLNSLYGKFFQKVAQGRVGMLDLSDLDNPFWVTTDPEVDFDWKAGGLYHPPIASLITGYVRARIHDLEHKYQSLMTSTDGIFGLVEPDPNDLGKHLGGLTVKRGSLKIWRERLYIFRPDDGTEPKWAAHGFRGKMDALDMLPLANGTYTYTGRQMVTLKLSTIGLNGERYEPGRFVELPYTINIGIDTESVTA